MALTNWFSKGETSKTINGRISDAESRLAELHDTAADADSRLGAALAAGQNADGILAEISSLETQIAALTRAVEKMRGEHAATLSREQRDAELKRIGAVKKSVTASFVRLDKLTADAIERCTALFGIIKDFDGAVADIITTSASIGGHLPELGIDLTRILRALLSGPEAFKAAQTEHASNVGALRSVADREIQNARSMADPGGVQSETMPQTENVGPRRKVGPGVFLEKINAPAQRGPVTPITTKEERGSARDYAPIVAPAVAGLTARTPRTHGAVTVWSE